MPDAHPIEAPSAPARDEAHAMAVADLRPVADEATAPVGPLENASPPDAPAAADEGAAPLWAVSRTPPGRGDDTADALAPDALSPGTAPDTGHSTGTRDASGAEPDGPLTPMDTWEAGEDRRLAGDIIAHREQQDILRQQGNEQGAREIEDFISKLPTTDAIKADPRGYLDGLGNGEVPPSAPDAASDATTAAGPEAMERWEASEDRILRDNADYFDGEAQRYRDLGDHDAASASQEAAERARSLIGGSAQPNSADTPQPADSPLSGTDTSRRESDIGPHRDEETPDDHRREGAAASARAGAAYREADRIIDRDREAGWVTRAEDSIEKGGEERATAQREHARANQAERFGLENESWNLRVQAQALERDGDEAGAAALRNEADAKMAAASQRLDRALGHLEKAQTQESILSDSWNGKWLSGQCETLATVMENVNVPEEVGPVRDLAVLGLRTIGPMLEVYGPEGLREMLGDFARQVRARRL